MVEDEHRKANEFLSCQAASKDSDESTPENEIHDIAPDLDEKPPTMDPKFATCFDSAPNACTMEAIAIFMWQKCFREECGGSVADMIQAAFADHYDNL